MKESIVETLSYIRSHMTAENAGAFFVNLHPHTVALHPAPGEEGGPIFTDFEAHKYFEIAIQLDKQSLLQIGPNYYKLKKHQFCIISHDERHRLSWDASSEQAGGMLWIGVTADTVRTGYSTYSDASRSKIWGSDLHLPGNFLIGEILAERAAMGEGAAEAIVSYVGTFLSLLIRKLNFEGDPAGHNWSGDVVGELQSYIREHLDSTLSLQELSNLVSLSPNYLCKVFKQVTGETITNYIQDIKIQKAAEYLADSTFSLSEIAEKLGFYDQFHFSKVFKTFTSMSPSEYRNSLPAGGAERE